MRRIAVLLVAAGAAVLPACAAGPGPVPVAAPVEATPGAPGIGDPYFPLDGNGGYDVDRYDLDVTYTPATDVLAGVATVSARATQGLSAFNLDLSGLEVRAVTVDGAEAAFTRDGGELTVTPAAPLAEGAAFTTVVTYDGVPQLVEDSFSAAGFFATGDGALVVGQPDVAATWFPANDHPLDPAAFTFRITAPEGLEAVANGVLESTTGSGGTTTTTWVADRPMAPYLAGMAIGEFDVLAYEQGGIRYWDAFATDLGAVDAVARAALARQPEVLGYLAQVFGPYPFDVAGGIVDAEPRLAFALENQTRPIYAPSFFDGVVSGESVVVHELAHQWFGDDLPLARWSDIWLNEGFATYAEWLWSEHEGRETVAQQFATVTAIPADDPFWTLPIGDPGPDRIFDEAVYVRGAMTLQALRTTVGDEAFFRILPEWTARRSGQNVRTAEFVALAEEVSGQQLDDLFTTWLATPEKPAGL
ncbi:M1 family metallopeptidase [Pseudonocardia broussonetiae]|uniref:Aminopeptidase N n=1 Tax=Pseudonocardia broussonetiae TaxID=2736640 RepID=A0A6M6JAT9_9PSEU|nr:M1 family metallopeptidase [Pseudonocardia broussonetiae]QJY44984.1 M1 family metallopeptidase [Pseudonocardia broussonetiae]